MEHTVPVWHRTQGSAAGIFWAHTETSGFHDQE